MAFNITDLRPVHLASFEAINSTGNVIVLKIGFNLACDIKNGTTLVVDVISLNNTSARQRQILNFTDKITEELFQPQQIFLCFLNIAAGFEYSVQARLLNSEGDIIGTEFHTIISVPIQAIGT